MCGTAMKLTSWSNQISFESAQNCKRRPSDGVRTPDIIHRMQKKLLIVIFKDDRNTSWSWRPFALGLHSISLHPHFADSFAT